MSRALRLPTRRCLKLAASAAILGWLAACSNLAPPPAPAAPEAAPINPLDVKLINPTLVRARARWVPVDWAALPGWADDRASEAWPALLRGCDRPPPEWAAICTQARAAPTPAFSDEAARAWLQQRLQPYRVESLDGDAEGLITGYFEPLVEASRTRRGVYQVAINAPPADLATRRPYWTRQQLDTVPLAQAGLRGRALAYVADPLDALILQIQGSGRLNLIEADGRRKIVRMVYAASNEAPYKSVGRWLIDQGELQPLQASWPGIKAWAQQNPKRINELLWSNPRVVFFREEPLADADLGARGAQGVPLTPGRSVAVDPLSIPYGTPLWLDTTEPLSSAPLRRLAMAQDTGNAIVGAVRADFFWGWGADAEARAGRMKQPLHLWVLWPRP